MNPIKVSVFVGNRFTMWIDLRKVKDFVHPLEQMWSLHMLYLFCHIMHLLPTEVHLLHKIHFYQAVLPNDQ